MKNFFSLFLRSFLGMVSIRDVVTTMLEEHREEVGRLHEYISGSY